MNNFNYISRTFAAGICAFSYGMKSIVTSTSEEVDTSRNAICILYPHENSEVFGVVSFNQTNFSSPTNIAAAIQGLKPNSSHGLHIHEFGDLTNGCTTAGPHYNPHNKVHGGPHSDENKRHVGDLGNIFTNSNGYGYLTLTDKLITLFGEHSVIGRSCVVHADTDDLGEGNYPDSLTTGHSGARLACGVIGLSKEFKIISDSQSKQNPLNVAKVSIVFVNVQKKIHFENRI